MSGSKETQSRHGQEAARYTRRDVLKRAAGTVAAGAALSVAAIARPGRVLGANERIRVAVAGINGRGRGHLSSLAGMDGVDVTYLVDPDSSLFASRSQEAKSSGGVKPQCVQDVRRVLEDKNVDALSIATCNHWHSLMGIWACQAGKDVYVEKPLSHNIFEGRQLVEAARKYKRVVQHGTQQRCDQGRADEIAAVQSGKYGKLLVSKGYCCKPRWSIGFKKPEKPPAHLDFNTWLGPAPQQEYHGNLVHYNWHWFWDTGNGDTGNQGVHEMDVALWAIRGATMPTEIWTLGGRFGYEDQGQTPNTQLTVFKYGDTILLFETRGIVGKHKGFGRAVRNEYYTTEGMILDRTFHPKNGGKPEKVSGGDPRQVTPGGAFGSFIRAVRSRKPQDNNADVEVGHYSSALCHLSNISYRLGEEVPFDAKNKAIGDNKQVVESFETIKANCSAVGMDLTNSTYRLGQTLKFDPETEQFAGGGDANALLKREYRAPFVVPVEV